MQETAAPIPAPLVAPIRVVTALIVGLHLFLFVSGIGPRYTQLTTVCEPDLCQPLEPAQADIDALNELGLSLTFYAYFHIGIEIVVLTAIMTLITLLFLRASRYWIGVLAIMALIYYAIFVPNVVYALTESGSQWYWPMNIARAFSLTGLYMVFFIFPDGRFYPRWSLFVPLIFVPFDLIATALSGLTGELVAAQDASQLVEFGITLGTVSIAVIFVLEIIVQVIRYRRYYTPIQKQQARWFIAGIVAQILGVTLWIVLFEANLIPHGRNRVLSSFIGITVAQTSILAMLPLALTISIMRYRLWNIDLIIRRTLIYAGVTAMLALTYFGGVVLLQTLFNQITGSDSPLAVVASTLLIAALFNPLRTRVQNLVDRRFYRQKFDTQQTLERFGDIARDEVLLGQIEKALVSTIHDTMQPEHVSLWLTTGKD